MRNLGGALCPSRWRSRPRPDRVRAFRLNAVRGLWRLCHWLQPRREKLARRQSARACPPTWGRDLHRRHGACGWRPRPARDGRSSSAHTDAALRQRQQRAVSHHGGQGDPRCRHLRVDRDPAALTRRALPLSDSASASRSRATAICFGAAYDLKKPVNAVADESEPADQRSVGPTITAVIDDRHGDPESDLSIQELAVPGPLRRVFEEAFATARTLHSLGPEPTLTLPPSQATPDRNAIDHAAFDRLACSC